MKNEMAGLGISAIGSFVCEMILTWSAEQPLYRDRRPAAEESSREGW